MKPAISLNDPQKRFIDAIRAGLSTIFLAGWGTGKSFAVIRAVLLTLCEWEDLLLNGALLAPTMGELQRTLINSWREQVPEKYYNLVLSGSDPRIEFYRKGFRQPAKIYLYTAEAEERIEGPTLGFAAFDEGQDVSGSSIQKLRGRLRDKRARRLRLFGGALAETGSWVHEEHELREKSSFHFVKGSLFDNIKNLHPSYLPNLQKGLSRQLAESRIHNRFSAPDGLVHPDFSRPLHVKPCPIRYDLPLYFGQDFNNVPMSSVFYQFDSERDEGFVVGEIIEGGTTHDSARKAREWCESKGFFVSSVTCFPDASGAQKNQQTGASNLDCFREAGFNVIHFAANPPIFARDNLVNLRLKNEQGQARLFVDPSCVKTIAAFENLRHKGRKLSIHGHPIDAIGYAICHLHPTLQGNPNNQTNIDPSYGRDQSGSSWESLRKYRTL